MKIYKITTPHSTKCYVGKTTYALNVRFRGHRASYTSWLGMKAGWCSSFGLLMLGDCSIKLIEETEDKDAERNWIAKLDTVNHLRLLYEGRCPIKNNARNAERVTCDRCGDVMARSSLLVHQKRQKCKDTVAGKVLKLKRCICERCGTEYAHGHRNRHQRTKKCQTIYAAKLHLQ